MRLEAWWPAQRSSQLARVAVVVWVLVLLVVCGKSALQSRKRSLYLTWSTAGQDWSHASPLLYQRLEGDGLDLFRYSPLVAAALTPLQLLDESLGNVLWRLFNAGVLLGGFAYWLRSVWPGARASWGLLFLLLVPLSLGSLANGQPNPVVIGLLLFAVGLAGARRWWLAAVCVALACALKVYPIAVGLLLVVAYPRAFAGRLALALLAVLALPYLLQHPAYVTEQYAQWYARLAGDDRKGIALDRAYRDLWLLVRVWNVPLSPRGYLGIQLGTAAGCAALCAAGRWVGFSPARLLTTVLGLGTCWMMLCGPATESASFVQLAPALAWAMLAAAREPWPRLVRWLPALSFTLFVPGLLAGLTPWKAQIDALGGQPLATLLLAVSYVTVTLHAMLHQPRADATEAAPRPASALPDAA